ncbi:TonB-dependent receptor [Sphingomonas sp. dw_22]|uniref:TonB-dependent receptor n=1 Tax=Sphingomonas sp. dw_22 TaxID=2721175 RepID=UPI001BD3F098|nr:TonB-dependent receptor [Sphingomonas sp. dw_22]
MQASAHAQDANAPAPQTDQVDDAGSQQADEIIVTGVRASLRSSQEIKRNADSIVDSIVAEDIGKLPDANVTEALQRITGVQITRDYGEGTGVAIRGLPQVETTLNGREVFTAGSGRTFNFQDLAAELIAGIDVYKAPDASLVEGGIGGTIDVRTRMPFDFDGLKITGGARARYNDLVDKWSPNASILVSDRWHTGIGDIGALVTVSYQDRDLRSDQDSVGSPTGRADVIPGRTIAVPNGTYLPQVIGDRKRFGIDSALQWRPGGGFEFYAQYSYSYFKNGADWSGLNVPTAPVNGNPTANQPEPGSFETYPDSDNFLRGSFLNVPVSTMGVSRDQIDKNRTYAIGGKWAEGPLSIKVDGSYTKSSSKLTYRELDLTTTAPRITQDLEAFDVPSFLIQGVDLTSLDSYRVGAMTESRNDYDGDQKAFMADVDYKIDSFITQISAGFRYSDREAHFTPWRFFATPPGAPQATAFSQYFAPNPHPDFMAKASEGTPVTFDFLSTIPGMLRNNFDAMRQALGFTTGPAVNPLSVFDIGEKTTSGYGLVKFANENGFRFDGNVGVRVVNTKGTLVGFRPLYVNNVQTGYQALDIDNNYTKVLPSANLRFRFTDKLQLRLAASKTMTRPDFNQLSPSVTVVPASSLASSGNPDLKPLMSTNLDASLEYYFGTTNSVYVAGFRRKVEGFIGSSSTAGVIIDGLPYTLTQPINIGKGTIKGFEVGYQQFFDFLPGPLSGLGTQLNYTFVDSESPSPVPGETVPLPQLSRHSFNVVGIYEKGPVSARVAYNYRNKYYSGLAFLQGGLGTVPNFRKGYGWLDASLSFELNKNLTLTLEGNNLLRQRLEGYVLDEQRTTGVEINDRQFTIGFRATL